MEHHEILKCLPWEMDNAAISRLAESIKKNGLREPITTFEGKLLDGRNRFRACVLAGVAPRYIEFDGDFNDATEFVIDKMLRKEHTINEIAMAAAKLANMKRGNAKSNSSTGSISQADAAARVGLSVPTIKRAASVLASGDEQLVRDVETGKKSIRAAAEEVKERKQDEKQKAASKFNESNDNIEWARWTWNPMVGCKHGCEYCYAHDIAVRFYGDFSPRVFKDRLDAPKNTPIPKGDGPGDRSVFVCSMSDLFGNWFKKADIEAVIKAAADASAWTFIFLTKNPKRLAEFKFPKNAWVGTTVDCQKRVSEAEEAFKDIDAEVTFISLEPMMTPIKFKHLDRFDWVIIGGKSVRGSGSPEQPQWEWVESVLNQARASSCMVYFKPNLTVRPKEYPSK